jgi:hypothetical protein
MSVQRETHQPGAIPNFPFQEQPAAGAGAAAGRPVADLRAALDAAVQTALKSFHEYMEAVAPPSGYVAGGEIAGGALAGGDLAMDVGRFSVGRGLAGSMGAPGQAFPLGQIETGVSPRAVMTPDQQGRLNEALALAFSVDLGGAEEAEEPTRWSQRSSERPPVMKMAESMEAGELALPVVPPPMYSPFTLVSPPSAGPFSTPHAAIIQGATVAPAALVAAAPPLPAGAAVISPFQLVQPPAGATGSNGPAGLRSGAGEASWPTSPCFGVAQASTGPVELPPVVAFSGVAGVEASLPIPPSDGVGAAPSSGVNFSDLLRANGQR